MWTRAELKQRALVAYKRNTLACIIVALILTVLSSSGNSSGNNNNNNGSYTDTYPASGYYDGDLGAFVENYENIGIGAPNISDGANLIGNTIGGFGPLSSVASFAATLLASGTIVFVIFIAIILGIGLSVFLFNPLILGCRRFFLLNAQGNANISEVLFAFRSGSYLNIVKILFLRDLKLLGWTLLFIIPGIIKTYEYRMIPYLLSENPDMDADECFAATRAIMDGQKFDTWILELSFILWHLLSLITFGIAGLVFVNPYREQTDAELYLALTSYPTNGSDYYQEF